MIIYYLSSIEIIIFIFFLKIISIFAQSLAKPINNKLAKKAEKLDINLPAILIPYLENLETSQWQECKLL